MRRFSSLLLFVTLGILSCSKVSSPIGDSNQACSTTVLETKSAGIVPNVELGFNPYSLSVMQAALDSIALEDTLCIETELEATDYYIRVQPSDSLLCRSLLRLGIDLFPFPLDYIANHFDTASKELSIEEDGWYYGVVKADCFNSMPEYGAFRYLVDSGDAFFASIEESDDVSIEVQVLDYCYIPESESEDGSIDLLLQDGRRNRSIVSASRLELKAYQLAGYEVPQVELASLARRPHGRITFDVSSSNVPNYVGVKGIKVFSISACKIRYTYTDTYGYYDIPEFYLFNPLVVVSSSNEDNVHFWRNFNYITSYLFNCGFPNQNESYNKPVSRQDVSWPMLAANNAVYEYYRDCEQNSIPKPPYNLQIDCLDSFGFTGSPMLMRMRPEICSKVNSIVINRFAYLLPLSLIALSVIHNFLCDLYVSIRYFPSTSYSEIRSTMFHELTHASHFSVAGVDVWEEYVNHIIDTNLDSILTNIRNLEEFSQDNLYGKGDLGTIGESICELGESLAYATEGFLSGQLKDTKEWFNKENIALYDMFSSGTLTRSQAYTALGPTALSFDSLCNRLVQLYPSKRIEIYNGFADYTTLSNQSQLRFLNNSSYPIEVIVNNTSHMVAHGDTITMVSAPLIYESFNQFKLSSYFPAVIDIRVVNPGGYQPYLFMYDHRTIACDLAKSFWSDSSWQPSDEDNSPRCTKFRRSFFYTLEDEDFM